MSDDVNATIKFYCARLGFQFQMGMPFDGEKPVSSFSPYMPLQWTLLSRDEAMLMVQERSSLTGDCILFADMPVAASAAFYIEVEDLDKLLAGLGDEVEIVVPDRTTFYGMREVWIRDNNGYVVTLAQKVA
jgi:uncharacterized glyoxalase superfamily protein PhnB